MYIKSIVLDGFKSYGNRVEITGFDPEFNAITGLNGTGKSNILDSICFVLGITNLSNVRAGSLQELIYKHGQAGIRKATVSITFDNRDKKQCPIGYENHDEITVTRQVVMGDKNKYLINGINVQNKRVADMFCSVQLNVNNPHFLIMQGRITKVLNMKPPEILSMVEEAAGTRMYETKRQAAQKTIEKKDAKLKELNVILKEDIAPKLQKLQAERSQFQENQKVVRELENLTRLYVAWRYVTAEENAKESEAKVSGVKEEIQQKRDKIKDNLMESKRLDAQVADINKNLDEESGNILEQLQSDLESLEQSEASSNAARSAAAESLTVLEQRGKLLASALKDDEAALKEKESVLAQESTTFERLQTEVSASEAALATAQEAYMAVNAGLETEGQGSLQELLMAAKQEISEASTSISQSTMEKKHAEQRLHALEKEFKSSSGQFQKDQDIIGRHQAELEKLQKELSSLRYDESRLPSLLAQQRTLRQQLRAATDRRDQLAAILHRTHFQYADPTTNFDRGNVHGVLCRLMTVPEPRYCTALETTAGGRLYNVVVESETVSKQLLQRGRLATRTTFIPLNKIRACVLDARTVRLAQDVGGGPAQVQLALDLIEYSPHLQTAMGYVFGSTLVCSDLATARKVAFDPRVKRRAVTWDGDVVDPAGTLSGGARPQGGSVLVQLAELHELEATVRDLEVQYNQCTTELNKMEQAADRYNTLQQKCELKSHELEVIKSRLATTEHAQLHTEIQSFREQVSALNENIQKEQARLKESTEKAKKLEVKVKDIKGHREREFAKARAALEAARERVTQARDRWEGRAQDAAALELEVSELRAAVLAARAALDDTVRDSLLATQTLDLANKDHRVAQAAVKEMQARIEKQKSEIASRGGEASRLLQKKESLLKGNTELELKIKELDYKITELQQEAHKCAEKTKSLEAEYPWIPAERQYFGLAGSVYDFAESGAALAQRRNQLLARRDELARGLNARARTLLAHEEQQYEEVMRKKKIVESDRAKIMHVMAELDEKKKRRLVDACEQVNRDFSSIFSTLLPGAHARMLPQRGTHVLDGLEVEVGFNGRWKESLGELSGGQRSLMALSLVLAMLLFNPAPLYILDEVDAALDLSHTQNIGLMLKEHFTASQFIIVSLKDGMFNNANVLFRTRFVDGMSSVQRTVTDRSHTQLTDVQSQGETSSHTTNHTKTKLRNQPSRYHPYRR